MQIRSPLLTDFYQFTMAYGYWRLGLAARRASFYLSFRAAPFGGQGILTAGQADAAAFVTEWGFAPDELAYLAELRGPDGERLFEPAFVDYLGSHRPAVDIEAVPEGTLVFPGEPVLQVTGPLLWAQLLETPLLNFLCFQSLIATKALRVVLAAAGDPVLEFGLRRAQGPDGGLSAARAAWVGGVAATSNVLAGQRLGIPVRGTHAHSWVMVFADEVDAFRAYGRVFPRTSILLVDTYHTMAGVRRAVQVAREFRARGHELVGIRLDSGDLLNLSRAARRLLDESGFPEVRIVASGDLDEHRVAELKQAGAPIDMWGVGTRLVTGHGDAALNGVYKLGAVADEAGRWQPRVKISDQPGKGTLPGPLGLARFYADGRPAGDVIHLQEEPPVRGGVVPWGDPTRSVPPPAGTPAPLLQPLVRAGRLVADLSLARARERAAAEREAFAGSVRLAEPKPYPVFLTAGLADLRARLVAAMEGGTEA